MYVVMLVVCTFVCAYRDQRSVCNAFLNHFPPDFLSTIEIESVTEPGIHRLGKTDYWSVSSRVQPVSVSSALGLQVCTAAFSFYLGTKDGLRFSCLMANSTD